MTDKTLKWFDDKKPEEIINWMIENLTESQIRNCIKDSDLPATLETDPGEASSSGAVASSSVAVASSSGEVGDLVLEPGDWLEETVPGVEESQLNVQAVANKLMKGPVDLIAGLASTTLQAPFPSVSVVIDPPKKSGMNKIQERKTKEFRVKCSKSPFIVEKINGGKVYFWYFNKPSKEWIYDNETIEEFKDHCTQADESRLGKAKPQDLRKLPPEAIEVIKEYEQQGLTPPISSSELVVDVVDVQEVSPLNDNIVSALRVQFSLIDWMKSTTPELVKYNITIPPLFIYDSTPTAVKHLTVMTLGDGTLSLLDDSTKLNKLEDNFKGITSELNEAVEDGDYQLSANTVPQIQKLFEGYSMDIREKLRRVYSDADDLIQGITFFGKSNNKKPVEKSISQIEDDARKKLGVAYVKRLKPVKIVNRFGVKTVSWMKR